MINFSTPLEGMGAAENRLNSVAKRVAQNPAEAADPNTAVEALQARNQFESNLNTLKVGDEMTKATLDILA